MEDYRNVHQGHAYPGRYLNLIHSVNRLSLRILILQDRIRAKHPKMAVGYPLIIAVRIRSIEVS